MKLPDKPTVEGPEIGNGDGPGPLPFDPRETPPSRVVADLKAWINDNLIVVLIAGVALTLGYWAFDPEISVPLWAKVMGLTLPVGVGLAWAPFKRLVKWMHTEEIERLAAIDPASGDLRVVGVDPDWLEDAWIVDHDMGELDRSELHRIQTSKGMAYEVDEIDVERGVVVASWFAGASNLDVRRHKNMVQDVQERLSVIADQVLDLRANMEPTIRDAARETSMHLIMQAEGVRSPDGEPISESMGTEVAGGVSALEDRLGSVEDVIDRVDSRSDDGGEPEPSAEQSDETVDSAVATDGGATADE